MPRSDPAAGVPIGSVLSQVEAHWDRLIPNYPMQTEMLDETFAEVFDVFELATRVLGNFAVIALLRDFHSVVLFLVNQMPRAGAHP